MILAFSAEKDKIICEYHEPALEPHKVYNEIDKITTKEMIDIKMEYHRKDEQTKKSVLWSLEFAKIDVK